MISDGYVDFPKKAESLDRARDDLVIVSRFTKGVAGSGLVYECGCGERVTVALKVTASEVRTLLQSGHGPPHSKLKRPRPSWPGPLCPDGSVTTAAYG